MRGWGEKNLFTIAPDPPTSLSPQIPSYISRRSITRTALPSLLGRVSGSTSSTLGVISNSDRKASVISRRNFSSCLSSPEKFRAHLHPDDHLVLEVLAFQDHHVVCAHRGDVHQNRIDLQRKNIDALEDEHVIAPALDAADPPVRPPAAAGGSGNTVARSLER